MKEIGLKYKVLNDETAFFGKRKEKKTKSGKEVELIKTNIFKKSDGQTGNTNPGGMKSLFGSVGGGMFGGPAAAVFGAPFGKAAKKKTVSSIPKPVNTGLYGKGKCGKGYGKVGAKRLCSKKAIKETILGVTKPALRRLARRGGMKRMAESVYSETRDALSSFLHETIITAVTYTEHARRKTVTALDIVYALKQKGRTLYGFEGEAHQAPK